jgi:hypothetical protein
VGQAMDARADEDLSGLRCLLKPLGQVDVRAVSADLFVLLGTDGAESTSSRC